MGKVDRMQEHTGNVSREMDILRKNQEEMLQVKSTKTEMKNAFYRLMSRTHVMQERNSELEDTSIEASKAEKEKEKRLTETEQNAQGLWDNYKRCNIHVMGISKGEEREKGTETYI